MTWPSVALRHVARLEYGSALSADQRRGGEIPVVGSGGSDSWHDAPNTDGGPSIVVGRKGSAGSVRWFEGPVHVIDTAYWVRPSRRLDRRFLFYALGATDWSATTQDVGVPGLSRELAHSTRILLPPLEEQRRIADFLDTETTRLDFLVDLRRRQVEQMELREGQAITEILDDSGVPAVRLGFLARLQSGVTVGGKRPTEGLVERPYLRVANVKEDHLELDSVTTIFVTPDEAVASRLEPGDVLMTEGGDLDKLGRGTVWRGEIAGCLHQNHVFAIRCSPRLLPEYLAFYTRSVPARGHFASTGVKTTNLASTNSSKVRGLRVPLPSVAIQASRVDEISRALQWSGALRASIESQMSVLAERRQALITAAVTGQFDVTTAHGGAA